VTYTFVLKLTLSVHPSILVSFPDHPNETTSLPLVTQSQPFLIMWPQHTPKQLSWLVYESRIYMVLRLMWQRSFLKQQFHFCCAIIAFCCILNTTSTLSTMHSLPSSLPTGCEVSSVKFTISDAGGAVLSKAFTVYLGCMLLVCYVQEITMKRMLYIIPPYSYTHSHVLCPAFSCTATPLYTQP